MMKSLRNIVSRIPFYPFLLSIYAVFFLWQENFAQVQAFALPRSLIFILCISTIIYLVCLLLVRNLLKGAALSAHFLLLFFFYGHFKTTVGAGIQHRYVLTVWAALFLSGAIMILRGKSEMRTLTRVCNQASLILLAISLGTLGYLAIRQSKAAGIRYPDELAGNALEQPYRDVYYILVDGYPREDWLKEEFDLENDDFIARLRGFGFVIPDCTQANYDNTIFSMTATLNLDYLDHLGFSYAEMAASPGENGYKTLLTPVLHENSVMRLFREAGYRIITFHTPYPFVNFRDSDLVYDVEANTNIIDKLESLNFQYWLMRTSLLMPVIEGLQERPELLERLPPISRQFIDPRDSKNATRSYKQYLQNLFALQRLEALPHLPGKKFIYAHLLLTHPPFTFNPDGSYADGPQSFEAFPDQIAFTNQRLSQVIETILTQSPIPPIIIIQADHALLYGDLPRFQILNAYYLPGINENQISSDMTPVNTFRLILSTYLGLDLPVRTDQSILIDSTFEKGYLEVGASCVH